MSEDAGGAGGGFQVASAYVRVDPDASTFEEQLEGELGGLDYVVKVPVVPDAGDFAGEVDAAVAESKATVEVPVVPDTEGFELLIDNAVAEAKASVEVPVIPDTAGFAAGVETAGAEAGTEAGEAFSERFTLAASMEPLSPGMVALAEKEAADAGEASGAAFSERFAAAADSAALFPAAGVERDAETAAEESGSGFASRFASMLAGIPLLGGLMGGAEAEAAEGGAAAGEGFMARLKGVISGDMPVMETLMGAGFVAATAVMASKFQAAMELIHTQAGVAQSAIAGLSGGVLNLAGQVGVSPDSLAAALYHVESSFQSVGISGSKALQLVQIAAEGARTGNADLVDVTNALDATIVSGVGGITSYSQAMGALNAIVGTGDMTMQDLANAMGTGLMAAGKAYGQSIEQIGAALATLGDNNIRGAKAATDLRMAWQAIEAPLKTGIGTLNSLGLTQEQLANEMTQHGLTAAIQMFVSHLEASKIPVSEWGEYVTEIFGKRAGVGLQVLMDQLSRLQGKLPDITKASQDFGSSWAATEQTASQHVHDLEAGFESLMIRIGDGLLPSINSFMAMIVRNLPAIEHFGTEIARLVAPFVTAFFDGLHSILKELFGPLRTVTLLLGGLGLAILAIEAMTPLGWAVLGVTALITLVGLIEKYHKQIMDIVHKYWREIEIFLAGVMLANPFIAMLAAVIKYHEQILQAVEDAWHSVLSFFNGIKSEITSGFDSWWAAHGKEVVQVWNDTWKTVKAVWDQSWSDLMAVIRPALDLLDTMWQVAWSAIGNTVKTAWDAISAVVKIALAGIESGIKVAWDVIVGIFTVFLDLITGHWSAAWNDLLKVNQQIMNAISAYLKSAWSALSTLLEQTMDHLESFLVSAWDSIKTGVISAAEALWHGLVGVWDNILSDIESIVDKIKSVVASVMDLPGKVLSGAGHLVGSALSAVGLAGGAVIPGYAPGRDSVPAMLSPGEAVLVPEAVRAIGPAQIHAINAHYAGHRAKGAFGGIVTGYGGGGIVPSVIPDTMGAYALAGVVTGLARLLGMAGGTGPSLGSLGGPGGGGTPAAVRRGEPGTWHRGGPHDLHHVQRPEADERGDAGHLHETVSGDRRCLGLAR